MKFLPLVSLTRDLTDLFVRACSSIIVHYSHMCTKHFDNIFNIQYVPLSDLYVYIYCKLLFVGEGGGEAISRRYNIYLYRCIHSHIIYEISIDIKGKTSHM